MDTLLSTTVAGWLTHLGWALLHFLWQGTVIGLCYAAVMPLFRHASAHARYLVSLAALLLLGGCVPVTLWVLADTSVAVGPMGLAGAGALGSAIAAPSTGIDVVLAWLGELAPWIVPAWAVGVGLLSTRLFIDWYRVRAIVTDAEPVADPVWIGVIERVSQAVGLRRAVQLLESVSTEVPVVVGWLRPVVLVPSSVLIGLDPRQLELILVHELAHVRRGDYLINLIQVAIETLLFYHPVVRWISSRVREERENCCDDLVVRTCGDRLAYARALLELEGMRGLAATAAMSSAGGNLAVRIRRIIGMPAPQKGAADWLTGVALTAIGVASLGIGAIDDSSESALRPANDRAELPAPSSDLTATATATEPVDTAPPLARVSDAAGQPPDVSPGSAPAQSPGVVAIPAGTAATAPDASRTGRGPQVPATTDAGAGAKMEPTVSAPVPVSVSEPPANPPSSLQIEEFEIDQTRLPAPGPVAMGRPQVEAPAGPGSGPQLGAGSSGIAAPVPEPVVTGGHPVRMAAPEFPTRARSLGHEGYVVVAFTIGTNGRPRDIEVVDVGPRDYFSKAAIRAIRQWRFEPVRVDGQLVEKRISQRFSFVLDGSEPVADEECVMLTGSRLCR
jgi:bla regulator protein BlaR1